MDMQHTENTTQMDSNQLYLEEVFTDRRIGSIRRLTPVDTNGKPDPSRPVAYVGQAQMMTPAGALPLSFEIEAKNLAQAAEAFGDAAAKAAEETVEELKALQREAASSLVVPGQGGMPTGLGAALPGGGKIQLR